MKSERDPVAMGSSKMCNVGISILPKDKHFRPERIGLPFPNFCLAKHEIPSICRCVFDGENFYVISSKDMHTLNHNGSFGISSTTFRGLADNDPHFYKKPYFKKRMKINKEVGSSLKDAKVSSHHAQPQFQFIKADNLVLSRNSEKCTLHGVHCQSCQFFRNKALELKDLKEDLLRSEFEDSLVLDDFIEDIPKCIESERLILMPEEAIFLSFGVGCLTIHSPRGEQLEYNNVWKRLVASDSEFPISYAVYHYFRSKNWVPKSGDSYGASYLLYKVGPSVYHASYLVHILGFPSRPYPTWNNLHAWIRLGNHVSKNVLLCEVSLPDQYKASDTEPRSIFDMSLKETSIFRWKAGTGSSVKF